MTKVQKSFFKGEKNKVFIQFIQFGLVGLSNTAISYILNVLILFSLRGIEWKQDYIVANIISFTISIFWSFYWNNKYVFQKKKGEKRNKWKSMGRSFLVYGFTGYILNNILSYIWIYILDISKYVSPLLNLVISMPINFFANKLWAFGDTLTREENNILDRKKPHHK